MISPRRTVMAKFSTMPGQRRALDHQRRRAARARLFGIHLAARPPQHHFDQRRAVETLERAGRDQFAVAHDRNPVADRVDLRQPMGDVEDRAALALEQRRGLRKCVRSRHRSASPSARRESARAHRGSAAARSRPVGVRPCSKTQRARRAGYGRRRAAPAPRRHAGADSGRLCRKGTFSEPSQILSSTERSGHRLSSCDTMAMPSSWAWRGVATVTACRRPGPFPRPAGRRRSEFSTSVLLPAPFSPQMPRISPASMSSETSLSAAIGPKLLETWRTPRTGDTAAPAALNAPSPPCGGAASSAARKLAVAFIEA